MRISDWSSDVCSSDLFVPAAATQAKAGRRNLLDQLRLAAFRTDGFRRIGNLVQDFAVGATGRAVVVVNGHHIPRKLWSPYGAAARILKNRAAAVQHYRFRCDPAAARATADRKSTRLNSSH